MFRNLFTVAALLTAPIVFTSGTTHVLPAALSVQTVAPPTIRLANDRLIPGQRLSSGERLSTPDTTGGNSQSIVYLEMLKGGDLLIESWNEAGHGGSQQWRSGTDGNPGARLEMQLDGNLVIYSTSDTPLWASNTSGNPGAYVVLQGDRDLVIHDVTGKAIWETHSND